MTDKRMQLRLLAAMAAFAVAGTTAVVPAAIAAPAPPAPAKAAEKALTGKTVFLDPGHQGSASGHDVNKPVTDGRGGTKPCQTSGATGVNGTAEHTVNWDVVQLVKSGLESQGARVLLSRSDDKGWGGCIDQRAAAANASKADIAVSVHADSTSASADTSKKGFHIITPTIPLPDVDVTRVAQTTGRAAAYQMRDSFKSAGFPSANYAGVHDGIMTRPDIAAVNLIKVPEVFVEMGNLANPDEARALSAHDGQIKYAVALIDGIDKFLMANHASKTLPPSLPQGGSSTGASESPGQASSTAPSSPSSGIDMSGLSDLVPFAQKVIAAKNPAAMLAVLQSGGADVGSEVLKTLLSVVYTAFGGKLPI